MITITALLWILLLLPPLTSLVMFINARSGMRTSALFSSVFQFYLAIALVVVRHFSESDVEHSIYIYDFSDLFGSYYALTLDMYNVWFIALTFLIQFICILHVTATHSQKNLHLFCTLIFSTTFILYNFFLATDLLYMYVWFEAILIPFFIVIGSFGNQERRINAAYYFFYYTLVGSLGMLAAIAYLQVMYGTTNFNRVMLLDLSPLECNIMFFLFFIGIAIKIPLFPGHLWLPEAHVEAPTLGSIILAALLLKTGGFAIIRILIPLFNGAVFIFQPFILSICLVSMVYAGLHAMRQTDIKKIIALSSIVHMAFATIGIVIPTSYSIQSAIFLMLGHGLVSAGLFYCIGCIYDRYNSRDLNVISALWHYTPRLSAFLFFFLFANLSFPGTVNYIPELGIFWAAFATNHVLPLLLFFGYLFNTIYNIWLLSRILYGPFINVEIVNAPEDVSNHEQAILIYLVIFTLFFGFFPDYIFEDLSKGYNFLKAFID